MDPYDADYQRPSLSRSPTLRPDPRHQYVNEPNNDSVIRFIGDFQKSDRALECHDTNALNPLSPIICKRKAVLPAIGVNVYNPDSLPDLDSNCSVSASQRLCSEPPAIIEPEGSESGYRKPSRNKLSTAAPQAETNEASLSTSTADSGFAERDLDSLVDQGQVDNGRKINNTIKGRERFEKSSKPTFCGDAISFPYPGDQQDKYCDGDDSEYFRELAVPSVRKKTKARLEVEISGSTRSGSRAASRNSVASFEEEDQEPRFGDDSMLQPVSHQSVVAEDKLVSSRCRRSSKLLDKLMLSDYNNAHSTPSSFLSNNNNNTNSSTKRYNYRSFKSVSHGMSIAGQVVRPRTLPQLPPILKKQRTMELQEEREAEPGDRPYIVLDRPSAPSPSLTPPSPSSPEVPDCDDTPVDFIDCH